MTKEELKKLEALKYDSDLSRCAKKEIQEIMLKPYSFARVPKEIIENVYLLAAEKSLVGLKKERLEKLKYICEYFLSTRSKRRITAETDSNIQIYDKFTVYKERLDYINKLLGES